MDAVTGGSLTPPPLVSGFRRLCSRTDGGATPLSVAASAAIRRKRTARADASRSVFTKSRCRWASPYQCLICLTAIGAAGGGATGFSTRRYQVYQCSHCRVSPREGDSGCLSRTGPRLIHFRGGRMAPGGCSRTIS